MNLSPIERLPGSILFKIVALTPNTTLRDCFYVSKRFNNVLKENIIYLPKIGITKCSIKEKEHEIQFGMEKSSYNSPKRIWKCVLKKSDNKQICSNWDVAEFFQKQGHTGYKWNAGIKEASVWVRDLNDALENALTFVCSRSHFLIMDLENVSSEKAEIISNILKKNRSGATNLKIVMEKKITMEHINLIRFTNCETFHASSSGNANFDLLFQHPEVFKSVWSFSLLAPFMHNSALPVNDDFLLAIKADNFEILAQTSITLEGIQKLVENFVAQRRAIETFSFLMNLPEELDEIESFFVRKRFIQKKDVAVSSEDKVSFVVNETQLLIDIYPATGRVEIINDNKDWQNDTFSDDDDEDSE